MLRKHITTRLRLIGCYVRTLIVFFGVSGTPLNYSYGAETPSVLKPIEAERAVKRLPKYASFYYSTPAFFKGKIYVTSNIGVIEIEGGSVVKNYRWNRSDGVVEGPWVDKANGQIWFWLRGDVKLARFDGAVWRLAKIPTPKHGFITRGDYMEGYRGFSNATTFLLGGAGCAWPWDPVVSDWKEQLDLPALRNNSHSGTIRRMVFAADKPVIVVRYDAGWQILGKYKSLIGDKIYHFDSSWIEVANTLSKPSYIEEAVVVGGEVFMLSIDGEILKAKSGVVTKMEVPGICQALTPTSDGKLLAYFQNLGIYELDGRWRQRFAPPFPADKISYGVHMAEEQGKVVITVNPNLSQTGGDAMYHFIPSIWISQGEMLKPVVFAGIQSK